MDPSPLLDGSDGGAGAGAGAGDGQKSDVGAKPSKDASFAGDERWETPAMDRTVRRIAEPAGRRFDVRTLPEDMRRVYGHLAKLRGEEYGLLFVFQMRTAIELHRAWHVTLLTSNILQKIKDRFGLRATWSLGVLRLKFRVEDGGYELHRKVPYDYDAEHQDVYYRIAMALVEGNIDVHEALIYQTEAKHGLHTAASGLFLRDAPGRLILYPFQAATCSVIFFSGKWTDAAVAAVCGLAAGLLENALASLPSGQNMVKMLLDVVVGMSTGIIGGLWYTHAAPFCLSSVFMGTLYWFFYGTAFVIGLIEIVAGELETGVTRFIAVSVKTFVLSLGASLGLMLSHGGGASSVWFESEEYCDSSFVVEEWWRIPLYLLCCAAVLGQYRMPLNKYALGMAVQLTAYEIQFHVINTIDEDYTLDNLDTAWSNIAGAAGGVLAACALSWIVSVCDEVYSARLLNNDEDPSRTAECVYQVMRFFVEVHSRLGIGRRSDIMKLDMESRLRDQRAELKDPSHPRDRVELRAEDENLFLETIIGAHDINVWSVLMPAVYQLVPGSMIARLWFHTIFPALDNSASHEDTFSILMVTSASLAIGLIVGFAVAQLVAFSAGRLVGCGCKEGDEMRTAMKRRQNAAEMMYTDTAGDDLDPVSIRVPESKSDVV